MENKGKIVPVIVRYYICNTCNEEFENPQDEDVLECPFCGSPSVELQYESEM